ncbi:MAG: PilZ domain-containing protein [Deltaproteobacteria bacterium]|nr:PilZ domain-containing protein [Deltaproteobacteria bacterium]
MDDTIPYPEYRSKCPTCGSEVVIRERHAKSGTIAVKCEECGARFSFSIDRRFCERKRSFPGVRFAAVSSRQGTRPFQGELLNISSGGIRVRTKDAPPKLGEGLNVEFRLAPNDELLQFVGKVVWIETLHTSLHEFGVRFIELDETAQIAIRGYLED